MMAYVRGALRNIGYALVLIFWISGWTSDLAAGNYVWAAAGLAVPPVSVVRGALFMGNVSYRTVHEASTPACSERCVAVS